MAPQEDTTPTPSVPAKRHSHLLWWVLTLVLGTALFFIGYTLGRAHPRVPSYLKDLPSIPESERSLEGAVLGLEANRFDMAMMPAIPSGRGATPEEYRETQKQLYLLFTHCVQGSLMRAWPRDAKVLVGVPNPETVRPSLGGEEDYFEDYLKTRCGWGWGDVRHSYHPFPSNQPLIWTQDAGEVVVNPASRQRTLFHSQTDEYYENYVAHLEDADLASRRLPPGVSCEGGDLEVVWGPDGKPLLMLGRHRVLSYLKTNRGVDGTQRPLTRDEIEEAKAAFSREFGLPVVVVPEKALAEPSKACSELFHLDMVVSVMDPHDGGAPRAFVPTLSPGRVVDALFEREIDKKLVASCRWELDAVAEQLAAQGYKVVRLPFSDHPVRTPVNFVKYRDPKTGRYRVLLSKFPATSPNAADLTPQRYFNAALSQLRFMGEVWQRTGRVDAFHQFQRQIEITWRLLDEISEQPNPTHEECARLIRQEGFDVVSVPSFTFGSGGMHCQVLK